MASRMTLNLIAREIGRRKIRYMAWTWAKRKKRMKEEGKEQRKSREAENEGRKEKEEGTKRRG